MISFKLICFKYFVEASKAFLTKDICGQPYLCYLVKIKNVLNFLKMKKNKDDSCVIFSEESFVSAKDACELTVSFKKF